MNFKKNKHHKSYKTNKKTDDIVSFKIDSGKNILPCKIENTLASGNNFIKKRVDMRFEIFDDAALLGEKWDIIAGDNIFLKKSSLIHLQNVNKCNQRYYINEKAEIIFVSYELKLNIFTLKRGLDIKLPVNIIGIPFSVSYKGYSYSKQNIIPEPFKQKTFLNTSDIYGFCLGGDSPFKQKTSLNTESHNESILNKRSAIKKENSRVLEDMIKSLKGIMIVLNADNDLDLPKGYTLSQYTMDIRWNSFEEYISSMRSHYKYRVRKALKLFKEEAFYEGETSVITNLKNMLIPEILEDNMDFSDEMYSLYLEVYENSKDKLEKLSIDYFRTYPSVIVAFYIKDGQRRIPAGFVQLAENPLKALYIKENDSNTYSVSQSTDCDENSELIFLFAGLNHSLNLKYDIYMNMLLYIIRYAIENKYKRVNFGQTTMDTKLKLGAVSQEKFMYVTSSNPLLRLITPFAAKFLSYKEFRKDFNVFKDINYKNVK